MLKDFKSDLELDILSTLNSHVALLNGEGKILFANKAWLKYSENENTFRPKVGVNYFNFLESKKQSHDSINDLLTGIHSVLRSEIQNFDMVYKDAQEGSDKWYEVRVTAGKSGIVVSHSNITNRRINELAVKRNEEWFQGLLENSSEITCVIDEDGIIRYSTPSIERILGYQKNEILGENIFDFIHEEEQQKVKESYQIFVEQKSEIGYYVLRFRAKNGNWLYMATSLSSQLENPAINGCIINARDVSDLKRAQTEIQELARFPQENPFPIIQINKENKVTFWNDASEEMIDMIMMEDGSLFPDLLEKIIETRDNKKEIIHEIGERIISVSVTHISNQNKILYIRDITDKYRMDLMRDISFKIGKKANSSMLNIEYLAKLIHVEVSKVLDAKNMLIAVQREEDDSLYYPYYSQESDEQIKNPPEKIYDFLNIVTASIFSSRKPLLLSDKKIREFKAKHNIVDSNYLKAWVGVPLFNDARIFGILAIYTVEENKSYTQNDLNFLNFVGQQIGHLVERAEITTKLFETTDQLRTDKKKLQKLHNLSLQYQSMLLSTQLNPHFIFNSLNSIQYYILDKNPEPALEYLSNFSTLMRSVLQNSTQQYISLETEIEFLEIFLQLELNRYKNKFTYSIKTEDDIDVSAILLPPMMLQPFVENTVIHGVGNLVEGGKIDIVFSYQGENSISCVIKDNGVGRVEAAKLKVMRTGSETKSYSTSINNRRFEILNDLEEGEYSFVIKDRVDKNGKALGTTVEILFPCVEDE